MYILWVYLCMYVPYPTKGQGSKRVERRPVMGDGTGAAKVRRKNAWPAGKLAWRLAKNKP